MRISLLRISLLRFFKTFPENLAYAFLGLSISLLRFGLCVFRAKNFITAVWLMLFLAIQFHYCDLAIIA